MADKRIIELGEAVSITDGDYLMIDHATYGAGKVKATSFASAVNYSTTEQNTGLKWIDGKPIYQKTVSVLPNSYADISGLNIDSVVSADGMMKLHGGYWFNLNMYADSSSKAYFEVAVATGRLNATVGSVWTADEIYVTLWYTKTTDTVTV